MEKQEFVNSKLAELSDEFKQTKIIGIDGVEYTFEDYVKNYLPTIMRDDFTFGDDDFIDNIDTLIMFQSGMTQVDAYPTIEMPKVNMDNIENEIRKFIENKSYQKYLSTYFEYDGLLGTLDDMIREFIIPNIDEYGKILENGRKYSYQELITAKIDELNRKSEDDLRVRRTLKKDSLLEEYAFLLDYPVNDLNKKITTIKGLIDDLTNMMDYSGKIEQDGKSISIDELLQSKTIEAERLYAKFNEKNNFIKNTKLGISAFDDFMSIASLVSETTESDNIVFTLLINLLNNINASLSEEEKNRLVARIEKSAIKNKYIKVKTISILKGFEISDNFEEELDASETIKIESLKQQLKSFMKTIDETDEYTIETAYRIKTEFLALVDDFILLLNYNNNDNEFAFISRLDEYKNILATRCNYEEEKQSIISSYRRLQAELDSKNSNSSLDDFYFAFNSIKNRIEELKTLIGNRIKMSKKDQTNFDTMCSTVDKIKESINRQVATMESLKNIL